MREIPGQVTSNERRFVYVELLQGESHATLFERLQHFVQTQHRAGEHPKDGGVVLEEFTLTTPDNRCFYCFSFRGDLDGWSTLFSSFCTTNSLAMGEIRGDRFHLGDRRMKLADCQLAGT